MLSHKNGTPTDASHAFAGVFTDNTMKAQAPLR